MYTENQKWDRNEQTALVFFQRLNFKFMQFIAARSTYFLKAAQT